MVGAVGTRPAAGCSIMCPVQRAYVARDQRVACSRRCAVKRSAEGIKNDSRQRQLGLQADLIEIRSEKIHHAANATRNMLPTSAESGIGNHTAQAPEADSAVFGASKVLSRVAYWATTSRAQPSQRPALRGHACSSNWISSKPIPVRHGEDHGRKSGGRRRRSWDWPHRAQQWNKCADYK